MTHASALVKASELVNEWCEYPGLEEFGDSENWPSGAMHALEESIARALAAERAAAWKAYEILEACHHGDEQACGCRARAAALREAPDAK